MKRAACFAFAATLVGCGGGSPAAPDAATSIVSLGPQVLRITIQSPCALPRGVLPMLYTRVTVARSGSGWIANASTAAAGDVQVRLQPSGGTDVPGTLHVAGTITGTVTHLPELLSVPTGGVKAVFDGRAVLDGVAFTAGSLNASTAGMDGAGTGSVEVTAEATGQSCSAASFSWSIFPPQ